MLYYCQFPGCTYTTKHKKNINSHHIVPKEFCGSNKPYNRIYLCPHHHVTSIYIPSAVGNHSLKTDETIIIIGWKQSDKGRLLHYLDPQGNEQFYKPPS